MTCHRPGIRSLLIGLTCLTVGGPGAAWADTKSSQSDERGPRLQITAPGKMARLLRPGPQIDRMTTTSIPRPSANERIERAFANPTPVPIAVGLRSDWTDRAFVTHVASSPAASPEEGNIETAPFSGRSVPVRALDPALARLAFPRGAQEALPLERMGGSGYLASYVPEPLLQIEREPQRDAPTSTQAPPSSTEAQRATPSQTQPAASIAPPPQSSSAEARPTAKAEARPAETEIQDAPIGRRQPELPSSLLPTRPPLAPG